MTQFVIDSFIYIKMVALTWALAFMCQSLAVQAIGVQKKHKVTSPARVYDAIHMDPHLLGQLENENVVVEVCSAMYSKMGSIFDIEDGMDFKKAMRTEGGIDGIIDILRKHGKSLKVANACLGALETAIFYIEENQHYAGKHGDMEVLVDILRTHIDNAEFIQRNIGSMGGFMDFCSECGDFAQKHGSDELMMDVMKMYLGKDETVQNCLNGLTGNVYHSDASRVNLHKLGLIQLGLDLIKKYPYGPKTFLQIRQEVIAVISGLAQEGANAKQIRQDIFDAGYDTEVLKLMQEQPVDVPSQAKSCEFIRNFAFWNQSYAERLINEGAINRLVEGIANYKTPQSNEAGKFWNVDQSGSEALVALVTKVPKCQDSMIKAGAVPQLIKAAKNPEGGYQMKENAAHVPACNGLRALSSSSEDARKAVTELC